MFGQVEPLQNGTIIRAKADGDIHDNTYEYEIENFVAQGSSGIVYKAKNKNSNEPVILKEYFPYNNIALNAYYRYGGVIVKNGDYKKPYCEDFLNRARVEKDNNHACSGEAKSSRICYIRKILCANSINEPDGDEDISWTEPIVGIFLEMERFSSVSSYSTIVSAIIGEFISTKNFDRKEEILELLSPDFKSLSAYGILTLVNSIIRSVSIVHGNKWVHRDIKLENILFEKNKGDDYLQGLAILIDFGSAQELIADTNPPHAYKGDLPYTVGTTKGYQPPEIFEKNVEKYHYEGWTIQADIYQLGCLMYYLFCGEVVEYNTDNLVAALGKHCLKSDIFQMIKGTIEKALDENPEHRYLSTEEYGKRITRIQQLLSPQAEVIAGYLEIKKLHASARASKEDYKIIFNLFDRIVDEIKHTNAYKKYIKQYTDDCSWRVKNILELNYCAEELREAYYHLQYIRGVIFGVRYLNGLRNFRENGIKVEIDPLVICLFAACAHPILSNDLCISIARESLRFKKNESRFFETEESITYTIYNYLIIMMDDQKGGLKRQYYHEVKYLLSEMELLLEKIPSSQWYPYYYYCTDLNMYEMDLWGALSNIDKALKCINENDYMNRIEILLDKAHTLLRLKLMEAAIKVIDQAEEILKLHWNQENKRELNEYYARFYLDKMNIYMGMNMFEESELYMSKAKVLVEQLLVDYPLLASYKNMKKEIDYFRKEVLNRSSEVDTKLIEEVASETIGNKHYFQHKAEINCESVENSLRLLYNSIFLPKHIRPIPKRNINKRVLDKVLATYGKAVLSEDVIAMILEPGINPHKNGVLFTKNGICSSWFKTNSFIQYNELLSVSLTSDNKMALRFADERYEEVLFPLAKLVVAILNGETSIREY